MKAYGSGCIDPHFLDLDTLLPRESAPGTHSVGGWVGPGTSLDTSEQRKNFAPAGNWTSAIQSVACCYTDFSYRSSQRMMTYMACQNCLLTLLSLFIGHVLEDYCQFFMSSYFMKWLMECKTNSRAVAPECTPFHEIVARNVCCLSFLPYMLTHVSTQ
jgi:hypothetical protein